MMAQFSDWSDALKYNCISSVVSGGTVFRNGVDQGSLRLSAAFR